MTSIAATSTTIPKRPIIALSFGACGSAAALRVCDPLLPRLSEEYGVGLGAAAQTVTAFAIAYGVLQLAYGPIGDRYGKYRVITMATVGSAVTSLACALAPNFSALVIARMLAGATAGALIPLSLAWIGDAVAYDRRQPVLARFLIGQMLGIAVGQFIGGLGADHLGARPVFVILGVWFAATTCLMWRFARQDSRAPTADAPRGSVVSRFASVLRVRWARVVLTSVFLEGVLLFGALAFFPTHLHRAYGVPLTIAGSIVMLYGLGGVGFAAFSRVLLQHLGEPGLAIGGAIVLVGCFATLALANRLLLATLACLLAGFGFYMLHNTLQVNATQMAPAERGTSLALFAASLYIGQSTGVTLAGHAADRLGTAPVIFGAGLMLLALGVIFGAARARHVLPPA